MQKSSLNCGKLHLTNGAVPLSPGQQLSRLEADPLAVRRPGIDMNGIVAGVSVFSGRRRGFDGDQFG